jgi:sterol desaturase/sphingolipid hydroxylase (fatty acid hydroxylase superfamily)
MLVGAIAASAWAVEQTAGGGFVGRGLGSFVRSALSIGLISVFTRLGQRISANRPALRLQEVVLIWAKIAAYFAPADAIAMMCAAWLGAVNHDTFEEWDQPTSPAMSGAFAIGRRYVRFVLLSFAWELAFDFFHYWVHRTCHASPTLYRLVHKRHHYHCSPSPLTTYDHSVLDVMASNLMPAVLSSCVLASAGLPIRGEPELQLLFAFKAYVEVAGHSGVDARPRSFPQFCWLPAAITCTRTPDGYTGIAGHTREHDWHHAVLRCNFSKRFRLWDVVFGTYEWPAARGAVASG